MSKFDKFQNALEKVMNPVIDVIGRNKSIQALSKGFMNTLPITLGVALLAILINLPMEGWAAFLENSGLQKTGMDFIAATLSMLAIYVAVTIAYCVTEQEGENALIGAIITLGVYLALMPIYTADINGAGTSVLLTSNMGSNGIFVAMICALIVPRIYCAMLRKNIRVKLPESVPPMVSDSLSPSFVSIIIFTGVFLLKWLFTLTAWGDIFSFVADIIAKPVMLFGSSPVSMILLFTLCNLLWFFGIHPNPINNAYGVVVVAAVTANIEAYTAGKPLPYVAMFVVYVAIYVGGNGNTLGLCLATLFAKSEKYKTMRKLIIVPNFFNINEPVIFGFPLMLNPIYMIPMVSTSFVAGFVALGLYHILPISLNPTVMLSWVVPGVFTAFLQGGLTLTLVWLVSLIIDFFIYLPFFLIDDKRTYAEEQELAAQSSAEA